MLSAIQVALEYFSAFPLNLPDTPYTSGRVLHGVRVEMAKRKMKKKKKKKSSREGGDCNFPYKISRILNFGPVVCFLEGLELVFMGSLLWVDLMRMMKNGDG